MIERTRDGLGAVGCGAERSHGMPRRRPRDCFAPLRKPRHRPRSTRRPGAAPTACRFVIRNSPLIRHSGFVIRHCDRHALPQTGRKGTAPSAGMAPGMTPPACVRAIGHSTFRETRRVNALRQRCNWCNNKELGVTKHAKKPLQNFPIRSKTFQNVQGRLKTS